MRNIALSFCAITFALACNPIAKTDSETESVVLRSNKWQNPKAIPVCIINRGELAPELFNDVKNHTINEYASKTGVSFIGWGDCSATDRRSAAVRVYFNRTHSWDSARGVSAGGGLSMVGPSANACGNTCAGGTMRIDIGQSGNYPNNGFRNFTITQTRATMIHEFGHAVGLLHEHERTDAPRCNDIATKQTQNNSVVYVGNFDPNSIMSYCHNQSLTVLSAGDVAGIRFLYPTLGGGTPNGNNNAPMPTTPPPTTTQPPKTVPGNSFFIVSRNASKCVDVYQSSLADLGNIQQWDCNRTGAQMWELTDGGGGSYFLKNVNSGKCADVIGANKANGANVAQYSCNGSANQRVYIAPASGGFYRLVFAHSNRCLDVADRSTATGANIQQWDCAANQSNQEFAFYRAN